MVKIKSPRYIICSIYVLCKDKIQIENSKENNPKNNHILSIIVQLTSGDAEAFCRSNILKYASRYDKKGTARRDIIKILHYGILLLHFSDKTNVTETYNQ